NLLNHFCVEGPQLRVAAGYLGDAAFECPIPEPIERIGAAGRFRSRVDLTFPMPTNEVQSWPRIPRRPDRQAFQQRTRVMKRKNHRLREAHDTGDGLRVVPALEIMMIRTHEVRDT